MLFFYTFLLFWGIYHTTFYIKIFNPTLNPTLNPLLKYIFFYDFVTRLGVE